MGTKKNAYSDEATDFCDKQTSKVGCDCTCLTVIAIYSALKKKETIICKFF